MKPSGLKTDLRELSANGFLGGFSKVGDMGLDFLEEYLGSSKLRSSKDKFKSAVLF
jgi:hypothetical protein